MGEERKKIIEKINESLKICEEKLRRRLISENNKNFLNNNIKQENIFILNSELHVVPLKLRISVDVC